MSLDRQRVVLQPAYLLHQMPYRDTSLLLELMSREYGRVGLVARGARRPKAGLRAVLQPFQPLLVSWSARGDLGTLTGAESVPAKFALPAASFYSGYYLNELLLRLTRRHDAHPELYSQYAETLGRLGQGDNDARVLRVFEKRMLDELGYGLDLTQTVDGRAITGTGVYEYRPEYGVTVAAADHAGDLVFSGRSLLALASETLAARSELQDAGRLLRTALAVYLGPRPLKVRQDARALRRVLR